MFGYATDETPECMPLTLMLAHKLAKRLSEARKSGELPWLLPDCKTQVTLEYVQHLDTAGKRSYIRPKRVHTVVISTQHTDFVQTQDLRASLLRNIAQVHLFIMLDLILNSILERHPS
jgi:S-adenosylmethionine synthetase